MTKWLRRLPLAAPVLLACFLLPDALTSRPSAQTFRASTHGVLVDVAVMDNGRPVTGLTAADFQLTDNGVRQTLDLVSTEMLPLDVSLVVDTSGIMASSHEQFRRDVAGISRRLRRTDAIRVITFDDYIREPLPLQGAGGPVELGDRTAGGCSSVNDALLYALLQPTRPNRRHVIVAFTNAIDNYSWTAASKLPELARRSDALLLIVATGRSPWMDALARMDRQMLESARLGESPFSLSGLGAQFNLDPYLNAARSTGGDVYDRPDGADLAMAFAGLFDTIRHRYVLGYTPRGVRQDGWHKLSVSVPKSKGLTIRAREGYAADAVVTGER